MSDLIERLRRLYRDTGTNYVQEAADEIERLSAIVEDMDRFEAEHEELIALLRDIRLGEAWGGDWSEDLRNRVDEALSQGETL